MAWSNSDFHPCNAGRRFCRGIPGSHVGKPWRGGASHRCPRIKPAPLPGSSFAPSPLRGPSPPGSLPFLQRISRQRNSDEGSRAKPRVPRASPVLCAVFTKMKTGSLPRGGPDRAGAHPRPRRRTKVEMDVHVWMGWRRVPRPTSAWPGSRIGLDPWNGDVYT